MRDLRALDARGRLGHPPRPLPLAAAIFVLVALLGLTTYFLGRHNEPAILLIIAAAAVFGIAVAVGWALAAAEYRSAQQADQAGAELLALHVELDRERREASARLHDARALTAAMGAALHALRQSGADTAIVAALSDQLAALRHSLTEKPGAHLEPIEVGTVLLEVSSFATLHRITLIHDAADGAVVLANHDHLLAILQNLIDNARKYAPGSPILITCEPAGPYLKLAIQDEGPGIAAAAAEDLFLPGVRRGDDTQGYGMGLAISRRLAERMGGALWYEPRSGRGARFVLKLPRAGGPPTSTPEEAPVTRVLIVEDHRVVAQGLEMGLRAQGFAVASTDGAPAALPELVAGFAPDVVLLDLYLADGLSGISLIPLLRGPGRTVIVLTAETEATVLARALQAGADAVLGKTMPFTQLIREIVAIPRGQSKEAANRYHQVMYEARVAAQERAKRLAPFVLPHASGGGSAVDAGGRGPGRRHRRGRLRVALHGALPDPLHPRQARGRLAAGGGFAGDQGGVGPRPH